MKSKRKLDASDRLGLNEARVSLEQAGQVIERLCLDRLLGVGGHGDEVGHALDGIDEALGEHHAQAIEDVYAQHGAIVDVALENRLQIQLNDRGGHARLHVLHLLQVVLLEAHGLGQLDTLGQVLLVLFAEEFGQIQKNL